MRLAKTYGLVFSKDCTAFVEEFSPLHETFVFRYPEKMKQVTIDLEEALRKTKEIIRDTEVCLKMRGLDPNQHVESIPPEHIAATGQV